MKFVDSLPDTTSSYGRNGAYFKTQRLLEALRANPGQWAEINRYPAGQKSRSAATPRGHYLSKKYGNLQTATRTVGDELIMFIRAVEQ